MKHKSNKRKVLVKQIGSAVNYSRTVNMRLTWLLHFLKDLLLLRISTADIFMLFRTLSVAKIAYRRQ
jgi:hypothetical protein